MSNNVYAFETAAPIIDALTEILPRYGVRPIPVQHDAHVWRFERATKRLSYRIDQALSACTADYFGWRYSVWPRES